MRIKAHEYEDIIALLVKLNISEEDILFVKKKGWFTIQKIQREGKFEFHRKLETHLVNGEFQDELNYRFRTGGKVQMATSWDDVLKNLGIWLKLRT
jgi:hypothetical protein